MTYHVANDMLAEENFTTAVNDQGLLVLGYEAKFHCHEDLGDARILRMDPGDTALDDAGMAVTISSSTEARTYTHCCTKMDTAIHWNRDVSHVGETASTDEARRAVADIVEWARRPTAVSGLSHHGIRWHKPIIVSGIASWLSWLGTHYSFYLEEAGHSVPGLYKEWGITGGGDAVHDRLLSLLPTGMSVTNSWRSGRANVVEMEVHPLVRAAFGQRAVLPECPADATTRLPEGWR